MNSLRYFGFGTTRPVLLLTAHIAMVLIFIIFGFPKMIGFDGTVQYMASLGAPMPMLAATVAVVMEMPATILIVLDFFTRPLAVLLIFYTLGTAVIGHRYQDMTGNVVESSMIGFWKNVSIAGAFLLLVVTGPGVISLGRRQERCRMRRKRLIRPITPAPIVGLIRRSKRRIRHRTPSAIKSELSRKPVHLTFYRLQQRNLQRHL